jgi:hypothetical protein
LLTQDAAWHILLGVVLLPNGIGGVLYGVGVLLGRATLLGVG